MHKIVALIIIKILSAGFVAGLISFVCQVLIGYGYFSFMFIFLTVFTAFFTLIKKLHIFGVLCVDMLFILFILGLRVYILIADKT